jgi:hypothetical protein
MVGSKTKGIYVSVILDFRISRYLGFGELWFRGFRGVGVSKNQDFEVSRN